MILFCFSISSSPKVISDIGLGRLLDWVIGDLFVDIIVSFFNILYEFVSESIIDDMNDD